MTAAGSSTLGGGCSLHKRFQFIGCRRPWYCVGLIVTTFNLLKFYYSVINTTLNTVLSLIYNSRLSCFQCRWWSSVTRWPLWVAFAMNILNIRHFRSSTDSRSVGHCYKLGHSKANRASTAVLITECRPGRWAWQRGTDCVYQPVTMMIVVTITILTEL